MQHCYQLLRGPKVAVIHCYVFGVLSKGYAFPLDELVGNLREIPRHFSALETIFTTDRYVIFHSQSPDTKVKDLLP